MVIHVSRSEGDGTKVSNSPPRPLSDCSKCGGTRRLVIRRHNVDLNKTYRIPTEPGVGVELRRTRRGGELIYTIHCPDCQDQP